MTGAVITDHLLLMRSLWSRSVAYKEITMDLLLISHTPFATPPPPSPKNLHLPKVSLHVCCRQLSPALLYRCVKRSEAVWSFKPKWKSCSAVNNNRELGIFFTSHPTTQNLPPTTQNLGHFMIMGWGCSHKDEVTLGNRSNPALLHWWKKPAVSSPKCNIGQSC